MLKISDDTIEIIADNIAQYIRQGRLLKEDTEGGDGRQEKEDLELLWYSYIKRVDPHEKKYIEIIRRLLQRQANEVFDKIKRYPDNYKKWMFDKKKWLREFTDAEAKFIVKLYKQEGQKAIDLALKRSRKSYYKAEEIPISIAFDVYNPEVTEALVAQTTRFPAGVVGTSEEIIRREIANGLELGESIDKLRKRVTKRLGPTYIKNRSEMIARSETIYASNAGAELGYMQSGVVEGKKWLTALDERTCDPCTDMNNMTAPLGQPTWEKEGLNIGDVQGKYGLDFDYTEGAMPFPPLHPRCLIDGQVKIYTSKGWRKIRDIAIGDLVLTHKERFKKVTQLHFTPKQKPNVVKLVLESGRQQTKLTVTENHPILIDDKWVVAKDIKIGDEIDYLANKCKRCSKLIPYYNEYCSYSCNSKDITERQWSNPEHRLNMSEKARVQMIREYKEGIIDRFEITKKANEVTKQLAKEGKLTFQQDWVIEKTKKLTNLPHHRKANSERMKKNNPSYNPEVRKRMTESFKKTMLEHPERHPNYIMAQKGFISGIEKKYKSVLDSLDISYKQQYPIKQYFIDFAIPNLKIAVEIDGSYWHQEIEKDIIRQKEIEKEGWFFIRFREDDINNNIGLVRDETKKIILNHKGGYKFIPLKIKRIEKWKLNRPRMLYNLSVEDDESYIANGFLIHNCRCTITPIVKVIEKPPLGNLRISDASAEKLRGEIKLNNMLFDRTNKLESAVMTKERITKELTKTLKNNEDFLNYIRHQYPGSYLHGEIPHIVEIENQVKSLIYQWAGTSGDASPQAIAMQMAARAEFGLTNVAFEHFGKDIMLRANQIFRADRKGLQALLRAQYNLTQEFFKKNGIKHLTGYRGLTFTKKVPKFVFSNEKVAITQSELKLQSLSSFTTRFETAQEFAIYKGANDYQMIIQSEAPISRILSTCQSGFGVKKETEFVILGGQDAFKIVTYTNKTVGRTTFDYLGAFADFKVAPKP